MTNWTVTGLPVPSLATVDVVMRAYMTKQNIRAASVAISRQGRLVFARAYTNADPDYPITQPTSLFRLASCSKVITSAAIYQLVAEGALHADASGQPDDKVQPIVNLTAPDGGALPDDPKPATPASAGHYFSAVTVVDLLQHRGGWDRDAGGGNDPSYVHDVDIAKAFGHSVPVSRAELQSWGASQPMQFYPGSDSHYSNFGYSILGLVIEKIRGASYLAAVKKHLFGPLGVSRPRLSLPLEKDRAPGEVQYHADPNDKRPSVMDPAQPNVPVQYGSENTSNFDSFGGWVLAAPDYARFLSAYGAKQAPLPAIDPQSLFVGGNPTTSKGTQYWDHGGLMPGTDTYVSYRSDDVSLVVLENGNGNGLVEWQGTLQGKASLLHQILDDVQPADWEKWDLFPLTGIYADASDMVAWGEKRLDIVARDFNQSLRHLGHDAKSSWAGWETRGGKFVSSPTIISWGVGRLDTFGWGQDHSLLHWWYDSTSGWTAQTLGGVLTSAPGAASWGQGRLDVFALGTDFGLWHLAHDPILHWGTWEPLGGRLSSAPVVVSWGVGRLDVFALGTDSALYHLWHDPKTGWSNWEKRSTTLLSLPSVVSSGVGRLDIFALGVDNALWHLWHDPLSGWSAWESMGVKLFSAPTAVSSAKGRLDVFGVGEDRSLIHSHQDTSGSKHQSETLGGVISSRPTAISWGPGRLDIVTRGKDAALWHRSLDPQTGWSGWESLGGEIA